MLEEQHISWNDLQGESCKEGDSLYIDPVQTGAYYQLSQFISSDERPDRSLTSPLHVLDTWLLWRRVLTPYEFQVKTILLTSHSTFMACFPMH